MLSRSTGADKHVIGVNNHWEPVQNVLNPFNEPNRAPSETLGDYSPYVYFVKYAKTEKF